MAVPSISNIYPNFAHVGGESMVRILGGDFRTRVYTPFITEDFVTIIEGPWQYGPTTGPTVQVRFGAAVSQHVVVVNHALMYVRVPVTAMDAPGPVDVTVQNLDDEGVPIPGESVTVSGAFSYRGFEFTHDAALTRVVRAFIRELKRQVLRNVTLAQVHTDYDASTGDTYNLTELQELPSLVVMGPEIEPNSEPENTVYDEAFGQQAVQRGPYYGDLGFQVIGTADRNGVLLNLQSALVTFLRNNPYLYVDVDPADPAQGRHRFELVFSRGGAPSINLGGDDNNVKSFTSRIDIRQVPLTGLPGFTQEGVGAIDVTSPVREIVQAIILNVTKL
jgi:hypothetical protein